MARHIAPVVVGEPGRSPERVLEEAQPAELRIIRGQIGAARADPPGGWDYPWLS